MGLINARNQVTQHQRLYQTAYKAHHRIWTISPRSGWYLVPYKVLLWGTFASSMYMCGRKVMGHNTWFGKD